MVPAIISPTDSCDLPASCPGCISDPSAGPGRTNFPNLEQRADDPQLCNGMHIVSRRDKVAYKTIWIFWILAFPLFGGLLYHLPHFQGPTRSLARRVRTVEAKTRAILPCPGQDMTRPKNVQGSYSPRYATFSTPPAFPSTITPRCATFPPA